MENELENLAIKYGADKSSIIHGYTEPYNKLFKPIKKSVKKLLEVGVLRGNSLRMWRDYFPSATIYGLDNIKSYLKDDERIKCFYADQKNSLSLADGMKNINGKLDIIIDDGSHILSDQIITLKTLIHYLKDGGYYVIEDIVRIKPFLEVCPYKNIKIEVLDEGRGSVLAILKK